MNGFIWRKPLIYLTVLFSMGLLSAGPFAQRAAQAQDDFADDSTPTAINITDELDDLDPLDGLLDMSLEELTQTRVMAPALQQVVTTVSRQESTVAKSAAAVFVITQDMIKRSGARNVPDLLRIVPGVQVTRVDANKWAITIRGLNQRFANKLLVQIDGRTVYTPLFGGVYWDAQDIMLEDVERIEVIRGPGATVWGANAVNGVINILTKHSRDTVGALVSVGGGKEERSFFNGRVGAHVNPNLHVRAYGKYDDHDNGFTGVTSTVPGYPTPAGDVSDDWRQGRGGFRMDWQASQQDEITFQGDFYNGTAGSRRILPTPAAPFFTTNDFDDRLNGQNALVRWRHEINEDSDITLQTFYDRTSRRTATVEEERDTFDIDLQHRMRIADYHRLIWGAGYQTSTDDFAFPIPFAISATSPARSINVMSFFVQDEIELLQDELYFTVGSKFDDNTFTGFEYQPSGRLVWMPNEREAYWGAISRSIRRPTRVNSDIMLRILDARVLAAPFPATGVYPVLAGNPGLASEDLLAYEIGYRAQPTDAFSWDVTAFYNQYNDMNSIIPTAVFPPAVTFGNNQDAYSVGVEMTANYQINNCWSLYGSYSFLYLNIMTADGSAPRNERADPRNQANLWLSGQLRDDIQLDLMFRYVDSIAVTGVSIPSYLEMDVRVGWQATNNLELALVGRNLLDDHHPEFLGEVFSGDIGTEIERSVYGVATWTY